MARFCTYALTTVLLGIGLLVLPAEAQVQHRQLRKEVLESQEKTTPPPVQRRSTRRTLAPPQPVAPIRTPFDRSARVIYLENADLILFDQMVNPDIQVLKGRVRFRHDDAILTCDSAHLNRRTNSIDAFSNVRIVQGDTLFIYGDVLYYSGQTKLARIRGNVRLLNRNTTLTTDSLNYDRVSQLAYYFTGGKIVDPENTLTSVWGQYSTATDNALFRNNVQLKNPNFVMKSDTLMYNTRSHIANIVGETHIIYRDDTQIFTQKGWYNTQTERSMLLNRSVIANNEGKSLTGDTIFYDNAKRYGEAFGSVVLKDTVQQSTLYGNYIYYNEERELGIATDSALLVDWSTEQHLYIHADTLKTYQDSAYHQARAWFNVRFYREDLQGLSDSLRYSSRDSVLHLLNQPVVWQEQQQYSAQAIRVYIRNKGIERVVLDQSAMTVEKVDSIHYNQIVGQEITAHVDSNKIQRVEVDGNAETVYFVHDEADNSLMGANRTESSRVVMHFKDENIDRIVLTAASSGVFYPLHLLTNEIKYLPGFFWIEGQRPQTPLDVFTRFPKGERPKFFRDRLNQPLIENDTATPTDITDLGE